MRANPAVPNGAPRSDVDDYLILSIVRIVLVQDRDQFLRGGIPPPAARTDSGEPMRINTLAVLKRTLLRAVRCVACGFVDIEAAVDVRPLVARHRRALRRGDKRVS